MTGAGKLAMFAAQAVIALTLTVPSASAGGGGEALVVGDSLAELTSPYLSRYLPGVPLTIDAVGGSNSYQVLDLFEESYDPSQSVIVFDAGTNDNPAYPQILAENLAAVSAQVGDRCMVVPTVHGFTVNGVDNDGKNSVVESFAASRPGTQIPDWAGAVAAHPELMQADGLHPIAAGAEYRAQLIAQGIEGCLAFAAGAAQVPELESRPELAPVDKFARRQNAVAGAIVTSLGRAIAMQMVGNQPALAAALAMVSPYA